MKNRPCQNTECDRYSTTEHLNCKSSLGLVVRGCLNYQPKPDTHDSILASMGENTEVPKNGL